MLNRGMTGMTGNYKSTAGSLKTVSDEHQKVKTHVEEMESQYYEIDEELTKI